MSVVRAPVVMPDGRLGIRGWRGLCGCLWLGPVGSYDQAHKSLDRHRKTCTTYPGRKET